MTFQDSQLQQCYETHLSEVGDALEDLGPVSALIDTYNWFVTLEGVHSARVHETMDRLLSAPLRPALRLWYSRSDVQMNSTAFEFRDLLSRLAGERFDNLPETSLNPS